MPIMFQFYFLIFVPVILSYHLKFLFMSNKFCLLTKVFISKSSDKPSLVRESFVDSVSDVDFGSLTKSLIFLYGSSAVVTFEVSPVLEMSVR